MSITFNTLCKELELSPSFENESQLSTLESWCQAHVSQDICFQGDSKTRYSQYYELASNYLDNFLVHLPNNLASKITYFDDCTPIHYAAIQGYDHFIANQSDLTKNILNETDAYGMTALHKAAIQGYLFTVKALLAKGASVDIPNSRKQYPLHSALFLPILHEKALIKKKETIFRTLLAIAPHLLLVHDCDGNTALHHMAEQGFVPILSEVLQKNEKLAFVKNKASLYPIHTAILNNQPQVVDVLLAIEGVSSLGDGQNRIPLHYAARYGNSTIIQSCCRATSNINCQDSERKTPLLWAAIAENQEALEILIQHGADITLSDYENKNILHYAVISQNQAIVQWIINNLDNALLNQPDNQGKKPLDYEQNSYNLKFGS
ncbi:MAG: ankyrin repeat domain-containing protein [Legionella longbeachae]|nr:ankyrin repeat domain-containing protein [Legionella longbeachae]